MYVIIITQFILCLNIKYEAHRWGYQPGLGSVCVDCGYISSVTPWGHNDSELLQSNNKTNRGIN